MSIEIKAPTFPESVADGTIATWHKQPGEHCERDELIADIETDKVVIEVNAPKAGKLSEIIKAEGALVLSNEPIARFEAGEAAPAAEPVAADSTAEPVTVETTEVIVSPAAKKMMAENNIAVADVTGSGKDGRVTKEDVQQAIDKRNDQPAPQPITSMQVVSADGEVADVAGQRSERRVLQAIQRLARRYV